MKEEKRVKDIAERIIKDYDLKTFVLTSISSLLMLVFALFNIIYGVIFIDGWTISIGIYYIALYSLKTYVILNEMNFNKRHLSLDERKNKRVDIYLFQSVFLFVIDFLLIAPIILMVYQEREVDYGAIEAIAIAFYTTIKITLAIINYKKTRKSDNLSVKLIRNINLIDALASILTLQYTMIKTFDETDSQEMDVLKIYISFFIFAFIAIFSIIILYQAIREKRKIRKGEEINN